MRSPAAPLGPGALGDLVAPLLLLFLAPVLLIALDAGA
jgi:hypothetical protein